MYIFSFLGRLDECGISIFCIFDASSSSFFRAACSRLSLNKPHIFNGNHNDIGKGLYKIQMLDDRTNAITLFNIADDHIGNGFAVIDHGDDNIKGIQGFVGGGGNKGNILDW